MASGGISKREERLMRRNLVRNEQEKELLKEQGVEISDEEEEDDLDGPSGDTVENTVYGEEEMLLEELSVEDEAEDSMHLLLSDAESIEEEEQHLTDDMMALMSNVERGTEDSESKKDDNPLVKEVEERTEKLQAERKQMNELFIEIERREQNAEKRSIELAQRRKDFEHQLQESEANMRRQMQKEMEEHMYYDSIQLLEKMESDLHQSRKLVSGKQRELVRRELELQQAEESWEQEKERMEILCRERLRKEMEVKLGAEYFGGARPKIIKKEKPDFQDGNAVMKSRDEGKKDEIGSLIKQSKSFTCTTDREFDSYRNRNTFSDGRMTKAEKKKEGKFVCGRNISDFSSDFMRKDSRGTIEETYDGELPVSGHRIPSQLDKEGVYKCSTVRERFPEGTRTSKVSFDHRDEERIPEQTEVYGRNDLENRNEKETPKTCSSSQTKEAGNTIQEGFYSKPFIGIFSGTEPKPKNESSFEDWKLEVDSLMAAKIYPDISITQAIRKSLRMPAKKVLLPRGPNATPSEIVTRLQSVFGHVASCDAVIEEFYTAEQGQDETVADWGIRLEDILQKAINKGHVMEIGKNDALRRKFWRSLYSQELKNATQIHFENIKDFEKLRQKVREEEYEMKARESKRSSDVKRKQGKPVVQHQPVFKEGEDQMSILKNLVEKLTLMDKDIQQLKQAQTQSRPFRRFGRGRGRGGGQPQNTAGRNEREETEKKEVIHSEQGNLNA